MSASLRQLQSISQSFQVRPAIPLVGLEMIAFCPLIPSIEEQYVWRIPGFHQPGEGLDQPMMKKLW